MSQLKLPLMYSWDATSPPPRVAIRLSERRTVRVGDGDTDTAVDPLDFTRAMTRLCADIVTCTPDLAHVDLSRTLVSITTARNGRRHGLQARVTPLRFRGGELTTTYRGRPYQVQRVTFEGREVLYLVTFVLPRFLNRDFEDKLVTVFHELYHISPAFDGDLRRHNGRYCAHTASQKKYDAHMAKLANAYLRDAANPDCYSFLRYSFAQLCRRHGVVTGLHLPRPKLVPVPLAALRPRTWIAPSPNDTTG
jgi:Putative phage metallopeptidase